MGCVCSALVQEEEKQIEANFAYTPHETAPNGFSERDTMYATSKTRTRRNKSNHISPRTSIFNGSSTTTTLGSCFKKDLFECFNAIRTNPKEFASTVAYYLDHITSDSNDKPLLEVEGLHSSRIPLIKGRQAFIKCIELLNSLHPLPPLMYKEDLEIEVPTKAEDWTRREHIIERLQTKTEEVRRTYSGFGFHFVTGAAEPVLAAVLQIVDDSTFHGQRRDNILSHNFKYVGISSSGDSKKEHCGYINFAF